MAGEIKKDFETHWESSDCDGPSVQKKRMAASFLKPILKAINQSEKSITLMDAGCGDGIHALVLAERISNKNFRYIGLDISAKAVKKCKQRLAADSRFSFRNMDLECLENFGTFDIIISYGVVAYARSPEKVIANLAHHLKPDGTLLLWIYTPTFFCRFALKLIRVFTTRVKENILKIIVDIMVYSMSFLPVSSGVNLRNSTFDQCRETVLVNIRPKILHLPSQSTVNDWIDRNPLDPMGNNQYIKTDK